MLSCSRNILTLLPWTRDKGCLYVVTIHYPSMKQKVKAIFFSFYWKKFLLQA